MRHPGPRFAGLLLSSLLLIALALPALAQDPGPFAAGKKRVGIHGGAGRTLNQNYFLLGASFGYYIADGLEVGAGVEGWIFNSPNLWKLTPQVRYVFYQTGAFKPYVGGFYRWVLVGSPYEDYESYGGRFGVAYQKGGSYVAVGGVYERYVDTDGVGDNDTIYPEVAFWISF